MIVVNQQRGHRRRDRGAAAVEAALVIPLLLLLVFGIIDFGRMLNYQIKVTEAAREGARALSLGADARTRVNTVMDISPTEYTVDDTDGCAANPAANDDARVIVRYPFQFVTPVSVLAGLGGPITISSTGIMPCQG